MKDDIRKVIQQVREELVQERLGEYPVSDSDANDILYGQCVENAEQLASELTAQLSASVEIAKGGVRLPREPIPESYEQAQRQGTLHHWVVVDGKYHCNVVREGQRADGRILVSTELPDAYIDFGNREPI